MVTLFHSLFLFFDHDCCCVLLPFVQPHLLLFSFSTELGLFILEVFDEFSKLCLTAFGMVIGCCAQIGAQTICTFGCKVDPGISRLEKFARDNMFPTMITFPCHFYGSPLHSSFTLGKVSLGRTCRPYHCCCENLAMMIEQLYLPTKGVTAKQKSTHSQLPRGKFLVTARNCS